MLRLASSWVWDMWFADDGERFHVFFLKASRALQDPDRRHGRASVGHAVSDDLVHWTELPDALVASDSPALDDQAIWTGSVVRGDDGTWWMFYTGIERASSSSSGEANTQRVLAATSPDLLVWTRTDVLVEPDPGSYETKETSLWDHQAWRDPFVCRDGRGGWRMLLTARASSGDAWDRGVVGLATSPDLRHWTVHPPASPSGSGFGQLEVLQLAEVEGRPVLVFSCLSPELSDARRAAGVAGGVWAAPQASPDPPYDLSSARLLLDDSFYVGRLVRDRSGAWQVLAFVNRLPEGSPDGPPGAFGGTLTDPMPVTWSPDGTLRVRPPQLLRGSGG
ncbi:MAG: hypothetical protein U0R80_17620 [Nocardioidaceae bacterium]